MPIIFFLLFIASIALAALVITFKLISNEIKRAERLDETEAIAAVQRDLMRLAAIDERNRKRLERESEILAAKDLREQKKAEKIAEKERKFQERLELKALQAANKDL